jgi:hypothetical protein
LLGETLDRVEVSPAERRRLEDAVCALVMAAGAEQLEVVEFVRTTVGDRDAVVDLKSTA